MSCNLDASGVRKRLLHAAIYGAAFVVTLGVLVATGAPRAWRWIVWVPAFLTAIGFLQAATKTCVLFGATGVREDSQTVVRVENDGERRALLFRSVAITLGAAAIGGVVALVVHGA